MTYLNDLLLLTCSIFSGKQFILLKLKKCLLNSVQYFMSGIIAVCKRLKTQISDIHIYDIYLILNSLQMFSGLLLLLSRISCV